MKIPSVKSDRQIRTQAFGALCVLFAASCFTLMNLCIRSLKGELAATTLVFYRSGFQMFVAFLLGRSLLKNREVYRFTRIRVHVVRGVLGIGAMSLLYFSLSKLPVALTVLLTMTSVFWATIFAWIFLGERGTRRQFFFAGVTISGIALSLLAPAQGPWTWTWIGIFSALGSGFCTGVAFTALRQLRKDFAVSEIVFFFSATGILLTAIPFLRYPEFPRSFTVAALIFGASVFGTLGQLGLTLGFRYTTTLVASTCNLFQIFLTTTFGVILLFEKPPEAFLWGAGIVMVGLVGLLARRQPVSKL